MTVDDVDIPVVGGREPCPCGSGKRYKACHGRSRRQESTRLIGRPFEGLPDEPDWVALREIVPAATAQVRTSPGLTDHPGVEVTMATVLPMGWPALHRADGTVLVGMQTQGNSGDPSRDVAVALLTALQVEPGTAVAGGDLPATGPRLQDLLDLSEPLRVVVHPGFDFWLAPDQAVTGEVRESLERANAAVVPTERLTSVSAAYWCRIGDRWHLRWVLPQPEDELLNAIARLHAAGELALVPGARFIGSFRAHGLVVPVWDLPAGTEADDLEEPAKAFDGRLAQALAVKDNLTALERRSRAGVVSRQLTLR